jgi:drug/metabolite transporter (DMT)-like permease
MFSYVWPLALVVLSNVIYQICAKSVPNGMHPLAWLTVTYTVSALVSLALFFILNRGGNLFKEYAKLNWAPLAFGVVLVGLEVGFIYAYKAGWSVSAAQTVQSAVVAVALLFVGLLLYREPLRWNKVVGVAICLVGLVFINLK